MVHGLMFVSIVYSLLVPWHYRNWKRFSDGRFTYIEDATYNHNTPLHSYSKNKDPYSQGLPPALYYLNTSSRQLFSLLTRPANFKYFHSDVIKKLGKVLSYPVTFFWLIGFVIFLVGVRKDTLGLFALCVILYFIGITLVATGWGASPRFRIPLMPFISILSTLGWLKIYDTFHARKSEIK